MVNAIIIDLSSFGKWRWGWWLPLRGVIPAGLLRNRPVNAAWSTQEIDKSQIIFAMWSYLIIFDHIWSYLIIFDHVWSYLIIFACLFQFQHPWVWAPNSPNVRCGDPCIPEFKAKFCVSLLETCTVHVVVKGILSHAFSCLINLSPQIYPSSTSLLIGKSAKSI